ncbi:hypothetical protein GLOTRDRAFT_23636, partial [Gloeophyllum trabeum ATCC 11539]
RCNVLQSMVGIFLHSCNAPEAVIELLSQLGISISCSAIDHAISSLSEEAGREIRELGRTLLAAYAYDNFDVEIKHSVPTVQNPEDPILHLTSGTLLQLDHGVTREDLQCSEDLWLKSKQVPAAAMDENQSTVQGNANAMENLFRQGGIGDKREPRTPKDSADIDDHVILVHGDLSTCERVQSLQKSRSEESTPWRRFQFVVFVMGLFHLKMACADAIWKIFISPRAARDDETSLLKQVGEIRPKETGKISSKPGFRRMHEVIQHVGIASRLDCWREQVHKLNHNIDSLEKWAAAKPTWEEIVTVSSHLVRNYVAGQELPTQRLRPGKVRDEQYENTLLKNQHCLLYEELTYAMNAGDIGRVEDCFMPWVFIFRACGKHKYATQMVKFLHDVHFVYPERLKRAIRMNILCNPKGKPHSFRGIDWWVEHNNLLLMILQQRIYGGKYSNHTKNHILMHSSLIGVMKNMRINFEKMFVMDHRTFKHSPPMMQKTINKLVTYMRKMATHAEVPGRKSAHIIPDTLRDGM